jgi:hypothetical protein
MCGQLVRIVVVRAVVNRDRQLTNLPYLHSKPMVLILSKMFKSMLTKTADQQVTNFVNPAAVVISSTATCHQFAKPHNNLFH